MSGKVFSFDFNKATPSFRFLGGRIGARLEDVASDIAAAYPLAEAEALQVARYLIARTARESNADATAQKALRAVYRSLYRTERKVRERLGRPPLGRTKLSAEELECRASMFAAITWLQELKRGPLTRAGAFTEAAKVRLGPHVRQDMLKAEVAATKEKLKDFSRKGDPRYPHHRQALATVRYEIWEQFTGTWETKSGVPLEREPRDATPDDVLFWLRRKIHGAQKK